MNATPPSGPTRPQRPDAGTPPAGHALDSRELFRHGNTVFIEHAGQRYQLRLTRENKLILTK